jgi:hypothetical protein
MCNGDYITAQKNWRDIGSTWNTSNKVKKSQGRRAKEHIHIGRKNPQGRIRSLVDNSEAMNTIILFLLLPHSKDVSHARPTQ